MLGFSVASITQKQWIPGYFYYTSIFALYFNPLLSKISLYNVTFSIKGIRIPNSLFPLVILKYWSGGSIFHSGCHFSCYQRLISYYPGIPKHTVSSLPNSSLFRYHPGSKDEQTQPQALNKQPQPGFKPKSMTPKSTPGRLLNLLISSRYGAIAILHTANTQKPGW